MDKDTEEFEGDAGKSSISADLIRGHINTIILRSLYDQDKYGYEIINEINEKSHGQYTLKQPTLYSALKRLENQGHIQAYWKNDEVSAGGRRKYFRLTESGREITEKNQAEWEYSRTVIDNLISDRNFDFTQPAPTPVDFKILKQATSRVPVVHEDGEYTDGAEKTENVQNVQSAAESGGEQILPAQEMTIVPGTSDTVYIDDPAATEKKAEEPETTAYRSETEKALNYSEQIFSDGTPPLGGQNYAEGGVHEAPQPVQSEAPRQAEQSFEEQTVKAEDDRPIYSLPSESYAQMREQTYSETIRKTAPPPVQEPPFQGEQLEREQARYTSQLGRSAADDERRIAHENYLKLIAGDETRRQERSAESEEDARKLVYNFRPEQERDYKNLIDKLFDSTLKNNEPAPIQPTPPQPEPEPQEEQVVMPKTYVRNSFFDAGDKAAADGLKINTSDEAFAAGTAKQTTYNKGATLFKCSLIVGVIILLEFTLILLFRGDLGLRSVAYPVVILTLGLALVLVCGILYGAGYGVNVRKPTSLRYIMTMVIITVLAIVIILVFALVLKVNWTDSADILVKVVIPCIVALNIPIFTLCFYLFTK